MGISGTAEILYIGMASLKAKLKSGGKEVRSPGSSIFPMWFLMRTCDDELHFLLSTGWKIDGMEDRRDGRGGHIPTSTIEVVCACIFVIQIYILTSIGVGERRRGALFFSF